MDTTVRILIAVTVFAALIWTARLIDKKWRVKNPDEKPFAWGYFQALCFFPAGLLWFIIPFVEGGISWPLGISIVAYGFLGSYAGYALLTQKRKWAWIFIVLAQLNLLTWIIDFYYGGNRWKEFR